MDRDGFDAAMAEIMISVRLSSRLKSSSNYQEKRDSHRKNRRVHRYILPLVHR